jgi:hypothetical protein
MPERASAREERSPSVEYVRYPGARHERRELGRVGLEQGRFQSRTGWAINQCSGCATVRLMCGGRVPDLGN